MNKLILTPVKAYTVRASIDDKRDAEQGIYSDFSKASLASIECGVWGEDGKVKDKENIYSDEEGNAYIVKKFGPFTDVKAEKIAAIKRRLEAILTKEEIEFIKGNL
jgi:hypothetical protein